MFNTNITMGTNSKYVVISILNKSKIKIRINKLLYYSNKLTWLYPP